MSGAERGKEFAYGYSILGGCSLHRTVCCSGAHTPGCFFSRGYGATAGKQSLVISRDIVLPVWTSTEERRESHKVLLSPSVEANLRHGSEKADAKKIESECCLLLDRNDYLSSCRTPSHQDIYV